MNDDRLKAEKVLFALASGKSRQEVADEFYSDCQDPLKRVSETLSAFKRGRWVLTQGPNN